MGRDDERVVVMMTCAHLQTTIGPARPFFYCVAAHPHTACDQLSHGGTTHTETCDACGCVRSRNENGNRCEVSAWREPAGRYWAAVLDGDFAGADKRTSRQEAERDAGWLRGHPACRDRVLFGHGGVVRVVRVTQDESTREWFEVTS